MMYVGEDFMMHNTGLRYMRKLFMGAVLSATVLLPNASAALVAKPTDFDVIYLYPLLLALFVAALLWKFFVPRQLSALQVAFEIDDNLYCLLYTSPSPRDRQKSRMPSSA